MPYLLKRVINVQRVTCVTNDEVTGHGGAELTVQKLQSYAGTADGNEEVLNAFLHLLNTGEYADRRRTHIFNS